MRILGYGKKIPEKVVTNFDLEQQIDTSDEWIVQRTGIKQRYISDVETSELAYECALDALNNAKINKDEIDLIVVATITADYITPSVACLVQEKLGISKPIMAFDINAACSGFVYALHIAESLLHSQYKKALVIGVETMSRIIDFKDRNTCILFGDGAGAVIIEKSDTMNLYSCKSVGNKDYLYAKSFGLNNELKQRSLNAEFLKMDGKEVFKFACNAMEESINEILALNGLTIDEIDLIIPHQANKRIIDYVGKKIKVSADKLFVNVEKYGNTSAASIAIALCEAIQQFPKNSKVLLVGFGAGLTYASTIITI